MDDLEQRLFDDLTTAAEAADLAVPDRAGIVATVHHRRRRRRLRTGLVAAVALVTAGAVSTYLATDDRDRTTIGDESTTTTTERPTTTTTTTAPPPAPTAPNTTAPPPPVVEGLPVVESLPLRATGVGPFTFGAADTAVPTVVSAVTAALGPPTSGPSFPEARGCAGPPTDPSWVYVTEVQYPSLTLSFAGPDPGSMRFVAYSATRLPDASSTLRVADGPALDEPLAMWQTRYGAALTPTSSQPSYRGFDLELADGAVRLEELGAATGELIMRVSAGPYCGGGD